MSPLFNGFTRPDLALGQTSHSARPRTRPDVTLPVIVRGCKLETDNSSNLGSVQEERFDALYPAAKSHSNGLTPVLCLLHWFISRQLLYRYRCDTKHPFFRSHGFLVSVMKPQFHRVETEIINIVVDDLWLKQPSKVIIVSLSHCTEASQPFNIGFRPYIPSHVDRLGGMY